MPPSPRDELTPPWARSDSLVARAVAQPVQRFLHTEASGGIVLAVAAVVALAWANSPWSASYTTFWHTEVALHVGSFHLDETLGHWVNDLAMALFFFVVGLEIKREMVHGELRSPRTAMLPIACAVGGMLVPAAIFAVANAGDPLTSGGWGVPMATDIAFSIGLLTLVGRRTPASLKVFLLTLAIVDDIGAIVVIAVFYSSGVSFGWLAIFGGTILAVVVLKRMGVRWIAVYAVLAAVLWLAAYESGIHATIAGVVLGLLTPARAPHPPAAVEGVLRRHLDSGALRDGVEDELDEASYLEIASVAAEGVSPLERLERALHPWSAFLVLPLFALANAGVNLSAARATDITGHLGVGIIGGLVVGKPVGVLLAAVIVVKGFGAKLPDHAGWFEMVGVGFLAGIGFTVSLFVTGLAFEGPVAYRATIAVLLASTIAGVLGATVLLARPTDHPLIGPKRDDAVESRPAG